MDIKLFLDSTFLKTASQQGISEKEIDKKVLAVIQEAISENYKLVMLRPEYVSLAKKTILDAKSKLTVGTVISFPNGDNTIEEKLQEATQAINDGADDLDFVCNYTAFKEGKIALVKKEILECTRLGLANNKIVKWIIEVAALSANEIIQISTLIKNVVIANFKEECYAAVFVKSSTGFYITENNLPNGATISTIIMMLENASPLSIKASGGVKTYDEAIAMIQLGVKRIGTSSAKEIVNDGNATNGY